MTIRTRFFVILTFVITIILIVPVLVMQIDNSSSICGLSTANAQDNPCLSQDATISAMQVQLMQATIDGMNYEATITVYESENKRQPVTNNSDWTPVIQDFDGVEMVRVPAGCFDMGSTDAQIDTAFEMCEEARGEGECNRSWFEDEQPVSKICFDEPFWIDRYEVTNAQFASFDGVAVISSRWTDDNRPREQITWFEARDFCELRGMRLPTEAEWEYAAHGPDNLIFPWGNQFVADNVVYWENSNRQTAEVGSKLDGVSWVGANDLSGNVWEWISTIYDQDNFAYPYDANDGRESDNSANSYRILRGGSWNYFSYYVRGADRNRVEPSNLNDFIGFRCAREHE
jgi:formylglycine-generating enzyme required for sulfatase activity